MKALKDILNEAIVSINSRPRRIGKKPGEYKYWPTTKDELVDAINDELDLQGNDADLNCIDTSEITDMSFLFQDSYFEGDISGWDTSKVEDMTWMFRNSRLEGKEPKWYKK